VYQIGTIYTDLHNTLILKQVTDDSTREID
jgi:hypothetical protein